jgi:hypothetical protein
MKKKEREFWYLFLQIKRETPNFKNPSRLRVIGKKKKNTGDRDLDSYWVRYSKHGLMSCFKVDYELMFGC